MLRSEEVDVFAKGTGVNMFELDPQKAQSFDKRLGEEKRLGEPLLRSSKPVFKPSGRVTPE